MKRRSFLAPVAGAVLGAAAACSRRARRSPGHIRVSYNEEVTLAPFFIALEGGYFTEYGLEIEPVVFRGSQSAPLLAGGELDAAFGVLSPTFVNAIVRGGKAAIVAGRARATEACGDLAILLGRRDAFPNGIDDPHYLVGKRLALGRTTSTSAFAADLHMRSAGLSLDDVSVVYMPFQEAVSAFASGAVDAAVLVNDLHDDVNVFRDITVRGPGIGHYIPGYQYTFVLFGRRLLEADPQYGGAFLAAYLRGDREFVRGKLPRFTLDLAAKEHLELPHITPQCRYAYSPRGEIDRRSVQALLEWMLRNKFVTDPIQLGQLIDERFLRVAHGLLHDEDLPG